MIYILLLFPFILLPISTIVLLFLRDADQHRKRYLNIILIVNNILFFSPIAIRHSLHLFTSNIQDEYIDKYFLFTYVILFPVCGFTHLILSILKIVFAAKRTEN